jgi:hypothetical protein
MLQSNLRDTIPVEFFPPDLAKIHRAYGAGGVWKPGVFFQRWWLQMMIDLIENM